MASTDIKVSEAGELLPPILDVFSISGALQDASHSDDVNITIAHLGQVDVDGVPIEYSTALIEDSVRAHVHMENPETYIVMNGVGLMHLGKVTYAQGAARSAWQEPVEVTAGSVFEIPTGYAHSLQNIGKGPLIIVFFGSPRNLTTDRILVDNPGTNLSDLKKIAARG